jgi:ketosteroid isomerase-like protein
VSDAAKANAALIERVYSAFARRDVEAMLACYHADVAFRDPVFGELAGREVRAMWRMLTARATDLAIEFTRVAATERDGSAHWKARYTYSATEGLSGQMMRRIYGESRWRAVLTSTAAIAVRAIGHNLLLFAALGIALATV